MAPPPPTASRAALGNGNPLRYLAVLCVYLTCVSMHALTTVCAALSTTGSDLQKDQSDVHQVSSVADEDDFDTESDLTAPKEEDTRGSVGNEDAERRDMEDGCCPICMDKEETELVAYHDGMHKICRGCIEKCPKCPICRFDPRDPITEAIKGLKDGKSGILDNKDLGDAGVGRLLAGLAEEDLFGKVKALWLTANDLSDDSVEKLAEHRWPALKVLLLQRNPKISSIKPLIDHQQNFPALRNLEITGPNPARELTAAFEADHGLFPQLNWIVVFGVDDASHVEALRAALANAGRDEIRAY